MTHRRKTHRARLLGLEESECMILEAWVPPTPGTNGEVLFFAIWCLPLKRQKKPSENTLPGAAPLWPESVVQVRFTSDGKRHFFEIKPLLNFH